jgi:alpha-L-rhamnosidase
VEPTATPPALTTTALFAHAARCMHAVATRLDRSEDATTFKTHEVGITDAFNREFLNASRESYGSQCADAVALELSLAGPAQVKAIARAMNTDVMQTQKVHHTTGIFGTRYLYPALARNGYGASALALLRQTTYPSIGHLFSLGATTFWECWGEPELDKKWGARSLNHVMQAAFVAWFYNGLAGINPNAGSPGFKHVLLQPQFITDEKLTSVKATHTSLHGPIVSQWEARDGQIHYHCEIPPNTTATVDLPNQTSETIGSGSYDFKIKSG